jgi:hypothetical protein
MFILSQLMGASRLEPGCGTKGRRNITVHVRFLVTEFKQDVGNSQFNVLQLILGFLSLCLSEVLKVVFVGS